MEGDSVGWRLLLTIIVVGVLTYVKARPDCHCDNGCYVNFRCKPGSHCVDGWSGPTCQIENIAFKKRTHQSGILNDCPWAKQGYPCGIKPSDLAVDGWRSSEYWSGTCTHTADKRTSASWTVDLGDTHRITNITIYFSHADRMLLFRVNIDNALCFEWSNSNKPKSPVSITSSTPVYGRNVTIQLPNSNGQNRILNLCEVEIHECSDGTFGQLCNQVCNCENRSEICNKITGHCDSGCAVGYTGRGCQIENIALSKTTEQSSTVNDCKWANTDERLAVCGNKTSDLAVDGRASSDYWSGTCTHTKPGQETVWWSVDLGKSYFIKNMKIYFSNRRRMTHFRVKVDDSVCYERKYHAWPTSPLTISCSTALNARNVTILLGRESFDQILNLCEVEIFGCRDGSFGKLCDLACNCRDVSEVCHKDTGRCLSGCADGYTGLGCQSECTDGQFGGNCTSVCYCRDNSEVCNKETGLCTSGCPDGYTGPGCQKGCKNGHYGNQCRETCGNCAGGSVCDPVTGRCNNGCEANWIGEQCKDCRNGFFGKKCKRCGHCSGNTSCNKDSGQCPEGCLPGWKGKRCLKECEEGSYGPNCSNRCGHCVAQCNRVDGSCDKGCMKGWTGHKCESECRNKTYGHNCSLTCGKCLGGAACEKINGNCTGGCQEGFSLPLCQECEDGFYGRNCSKTCGHCQGNSPCDKDTGQCPDDCMAGWMGEKCEQECEEGSYGSNCSKRCGQCVAQCDTVDGSCDKGCMKGWTGHKCESECPDGMHGLNCSQSCGQCFLGGACNKTTGRCPLSKCEKGWKGHQCKEDCNNTRTYGHNCNETCGRCLGDVCDPVTGHCPGECHPMYEGVACQLKRPVSNTLSSVGMAVLYSLIAILIVALLVAFYFLKRRQTKTPTGESLDLTSSIVIRNDNAALSRGAGPSSSSASTSGASAFDGQEDDDNTYMNVDSTKVKVPDFHQYITKRIDKFAFEYGRLPKGLQYPHSVAANQANTTKNRYKAMYPYDHSRVILEKMPGVKHSDYINASYIDTYSKKKFYIATQGPKPVTVGDFWRMVWQEESSIIVMLTSLSEGNRVKCEQYWPDEDKPMTRGDLHITNEGCVQKADYVIRELTVHNTKMDQRHHVTQLQYVTWPDHGVPSASALVRFWKTYQSMTVLNKKPFIIHCSAGVGRTGTFIALDVLMSRAREYGVLDVFDYVTRMREDRVSMVQTKEQYIFLHEVILEALHSENTNMNPAKFETCFTTDMLSSPSETSTLQEQWKSLQELHRVLHDTEVAGSLLPENIRKTRNKEVLPADKSRPLLSLLVPETNDYINAVFVPSESVEKGLVVTQTPLPWTALDFWRLVIEYDVRTVVNLELDPCNTTTEDEAPLWPQTVTELNCGPFVVSKIGSKEGKTTYVSLQVWQKDSAESTKHDVQLLYMSDWPQSQDTPTKTSDFLHLLNEVNILEKNTSGPIAVMCRDGATRCGLFCAAYNTIQRLKTDNDIDIYLTVRQLQAIRPSFLPSYAQYKFCYQIVKEFQRTVAAVYENFQA